LILNEVSEVKSYNKFQVPTLIYLSFDKTATFFKKSLAKKYYSIIISKLH